MTDTEENKSQLPDADKSLFTPHSALSGKELMAWTIKAHPYPMLPIDTAMAFGTSIPVGILIYSYAGEFPNGAEMIWRTIGWAGTLISLFFWIRVMRQKTVYRYRITDIGGEVEYWEDYPKHMGAFFKCLSGITLFIVICLIAVEPTFIWGLAGPVGIALGGAKFFIGWENEKKYDVCTSWSRYHFVTVDRKRSLLAIHETDLRVAFDTHLPKDLFEQCLGTLKQVLPPTAIFIEGPWKG